MTASMTEWSTTQLDTETMKAHCPWRRFFARSLDLLICSAIYELFTSAILRINLLDRSFLMGMVDIYMSFGILFLLEPLLLSQFGTTPGKWIFGISLSKKDGSKLSYGEGFSRLCYVFWRGYGFQIPIYNLVSTSLQKLCPLQRRRRNVLGYRNALPRSAQPLVSHHRIYCCLWGSHVHQRRRTLLGFQPPAYGSHHPAGICGKL